MNLLYLIIAISLVACSPTREAKQALARQWMITKMDTFSRDNLVQARAQINLSDLEKAGAYFSCNHIGFPVNLKRNNKIHIGQATSTMMACPENLMQMDAVFGQLSTQINRYEINGHQIKFYNQNTLLIEAIAADWD